MTTHEALYIYVCNRLLPRIRSHLIDLHLELPNLPKDKITKTPRCFSQLTGFYFGLIAYLLFDLIHHPYLKNTYGTGTNNALMQAIIVSV